MILPKKNNYNQKKSNHKGFTLIELMVVIGIIGLISSIMTVSLQGVSASARDTRRISDMNQLSKAIQLYYDKYGVFPPTSSTCCDGWDATTCDNDFLNSIVDARIMADIPADPSGTPTNALCSEYGYAYAVIDAGQYGCPVSKGKFFILGARNIETSEGPSLESPGFQCSGHNFQDNFEWVTGKFEKDI